MTKARNTRRENFDVTPDQQFAIEALQELVEAPSKKDALLLAVHLTLQLAAEARKGNHLYVGDASKADLMRIVIPGMERPTIPKWTYLVEHAHPWKRQLFVKGRKMTAATVWTTMIANKDTIEETAEDWSLPLEAVREIVRYCEDNRQLLEMEADEELRLLEEKGVRVCR